MACLSNTYQESTVCQNGDAPFKAIDNLSPEKNTKSALVRDCNYCRICTTATNPSLKKPQDSILNLHLRQQLCSGDNGDDHDRNNEEYQKKKSMMERFCDHLQNKCSS